MKNEAKNLEESSLIMALASGKRRFLFTFGFKQLEKEERVPGNPA
jgi:hypothetical protein